MTEENVDDSQQQFPENDSCPICGQLIKEQTKHICPEHILEEICREEQSKSEEFDNDDEKTYSERLDDADFISNYYDYDDENDDEDDELFC